MGPTETTIVEQFDYLRRANQKLAPLPAAEVTVFVGCGTSYNLALSLAARANASGRAAIAVPGGEWTYRPHSWWPRPGAAHVVALSRSGETSETIAAIRKSQSLGAKVTGITVEPDSTLAKISDRTVLAATHPAEGIVMTTSASLMLLLGGLLIGDVFPDASIDTAAALTSSLDSALGTLLSSARLVVFLGGGSQYGIGLEGALKLTEMSQVPTQAFHPLEYRHGPISMVEKGTIAIMLYSADMKDAEALLVKELQAKGAHVIGFGGPGDTSLPFGIDNATAGLTVLPALQLLGERMAQSRGLDTSAPRHLTKVVTLA